MPHPRLLAALLPTLLTALPAFAAPAAPDAAPLARPQLQKIYQTSAPGGPFGFWGPDVSSSQKVASRFTVDGSAPLQLARLALHLMNNSDTERATVRLSLQTDALDEGGSQTLPSGSELESWNFPVAALGWNPVQQVINSVYGPALQPGRNYWVVAESAAAPTRNPVWNFASRGTQYSTTTMDGAWQPAGSAAALTLRVEATALGAGPLPEIAMSLDSNTIRSGDRTLMRWDTRRARQCHAGGAWSGQWPTEDSVYVSPRTPGVYEYQLICFNGSGRGGAAVQLTVLPAE